MKNERRIRYPRKKRLVAVDTETGTVHHVVIYDPENKNPQQRCILELAIPGSTSRTYQYLDKVELFLTNCK